MHGVTVVRTPEDAQRVLAILNTLTADRGYYHAIDTETTGVNVKKVGPVGNGQVICMSIFCGEDVDFGNGPCVWVDNWSQPPEGLSGEAAVEASGKTHLLDLFADYLRSDQIRKVLHNLSFDKHMLANEGLQIGGFAADTMHMARMWDSSLSKQNAAVSAAKASAIAAVKAAERDGDEDEGDEGDNDDGVAAAGYSLSALTGALLPSMAKQPMKELFGVRRMKLDGTEGKVVVLPEPLHLQLNAASRAMFIAYSAHDARATWHLRVELERRLRGMPWGPKANGGTASMADYYTELVRPFGEILAEIEATGFKIDTQRLPSVQVEAEKALGEAERTFCDWASTQCPHARWMNIGSSAQLSQLLFAPPLPATPPGDGRAGSLSLLPLSVIKSVCSWASPEVVRRALGSDVAERLAKSTDEAAGAADELAQAEPMPARTGPGRPPAACAGGGRRGKPAEAKLPALRAFKVEINEEMRAQMEAEVDELQRKLLDAHARASTDALAASAALLPQPPSEAQQQALRRKVLASLSRRKFTEIQLSGLGVPAPKLTKGGSPSTSSAALGELVKSGAVRSHLRLTQGEDAALAAERALNALAEVSALETMISSFIKPLQELPGKDGRVHSSLNLNTETGRLSSQRPNLQNQPALDKDRFLIRDVFTCESGNTLIVADYEQLELRLLAHMTGCKSMIEAFKLGGDFHSRTAMGMYPEIAERVRKGELLIERETDAEGKPLPGTENIPLIKEVCAAERKKAKVLNFSIAYGKTAQGLATDWKVTVAEAKETLERWYRDRPEVRAWQHETIEHAKRVGYVRTDTGRYRTLPGIASSSAAERSHNQRAAINTPVQGTAADVVMFAMIKVRNNPRLRELGWKMVLQVHDELILEGPKETAKEALGIVVECMEHPHDKPFLVDLKVDAKCDTTWYKAK